ncbi:MAG: GxxExxY protein [Caldisericia bacterium]|nr:GxxExxY protein [Caldisericia bacterium]
MQNEDKLIYKELSYQVVGVLFDVYNEIGPGHDEKTYELAVATGLGLKNIEFSRQVPADLVYKGLTVGKFYLDFLIDNKIVLEIKAGKRFSKKDFKQVLNYLKVSKKQLAILAIFSGKGVKFIRLLNVNENIETYSTDLKLEGIRKLNKF